MSKHLVVRPAPAPRVAVLCALAMSLLVVGPAFAGPPLLCHPFDIGSSRSLPWDGSSSWSRRMSIAFTMPRAAKT